MLMVLMVLMVLAVLLFLGDCFGGVCVVVEC